MQSSFPNHSELPKQWTKQFLESHNSKHLLWCGIIASLYMSPLHITKKTYNDHLKKWWRILWSQSRKSTSMRAYGNHQSVYSHAVTQRANELVRDGKLGQNMPGFSSNDPGLSLSFKIRPCHTCGIISCTMTSPHHTTLTTERWWSLKEVSDWASSWGPGGGLANGVDKHTWRIFGKLWRQLYICNTKNNISEWQSLNSDIEINMWIFLENDLVSILSVSQNLALLSIAAGHKLHDTDNRYFREKQI